MKNTDFKTIPDNSKTLSVGQRMTIIHYREKTGYLPSKLAIDISEKTAELIDAIDHVRNNVNSNSETIKQANTAIDRIIRAYEGFESVSGWFEKVKTQESDCKEVLQKS